jgi:hypothetical protein
VTSTALIHFQRNRYSAPVEMDKLAERYESKAS